jgi:hypothetical protein
MKRSIAVLATSGVSPAVTRRWPVSTTQAVTAAQGSVAASSKDRWLGTCPGLLPFPADRFGNDFRQPLGNQRNRHFHMSTISTPTGDGLRWNVVGQPRDV